MTPETHKLLMTFEDAQQLVLKHAVAGLRTRAIAVTEAYGHVLAEPVTSQIEMPAFDKAAMDGFAFRHADPTADAVYAVVGTVAAGDAPGLTLRAGECARIMTGAPVPAPADTVIPVEETRMIADERVKFITVPERGAHVAVRGEDVRCGDVVLRAGQLLRHQEVAILAAMGATEAVVHAEPSVAFAATGEELVEPGGELRPGQIFNSNAPCISSQIGAAKGVPYYLGIIRDNEEDLRAKIAEGLKHDILVLSGGVSMGKFDFVPGIFRELGVEIMVEKLLVKPGRPTVFGKRGDTLVFGLPGNPVSTLYAFDQFVAPTMRVFRHHPQPQALHYRGELAETVRKKAGRLLLLPCTCEWHQNRYLLNPIIAHGSADIFSIAGADALALIPAGVERVEKGKTVGFRRLFAE